MLTNLQDKMLDKYSVAIPVSLHLLQLPKSLLHTQALLFEVQHVTSPRLPWLRGLIALFSTRCRQNRIHTVCN